MVAKSKSGRIASIAVLLLTIILGTTDILTFNREIGHSQMVLIGAIIATMLLAVFMLIRKSENLSMNISVFGLLCSLFIIQEGMYSISSTEELTVYYAIVEFGAGALGIYLNLLLYIGERYNQHRLVILSAFIMATLVIPILYDVGVNYIYLSEALVKHIPNVIDIFILLIYIGLLMHPDVKYHSVKARLDYNARRMEDTLFIGDDAYMHRDQFLKLIDDTTGWGPTEQPGVKEVKEVCFIAHEHGARILLKRCDDAVYASLLREDSGTLMNGISFPMRQITYAGDTLTCDRFTIYGDEGYFITMMIEEEKPIPEKRLVRIYRWMTGY